MGHKTNSCSPLTRDPTKLTCTLDGMRTIFAKLLTEILSAIEDIQECCPSGYATETNQTVEIGILTDILEALENPPLAPETSPIPNTVLVYSEVVGIGANVQTTIATYTATLIKRVSDIICSGTDYAKFQVYVNTVLISTVRSGPDRNVSFPINIQLLPGDIIDVKVTHYVTGDVANFESTILGF